MQSARPANASGVEPARASARCAEVPTPPSVPLALALRPSRDMRACRREYAPSRPRIAWLPSRAILSPPPPDFVKHFFRDVQLADFRDVQLTENKGLIDTPSCSFTIRSSASTLRRARLEAEIAHPKGVFGWIADPVATPTAVARCQRLRGPAVLGDVATYAGLPRIRCQTGSASR